MLVHRLAEALPIERAVALRSQRLQQFRWDSVGGVEFGRFRPTHQARSRALDGGEQFFDPLEAAVDGGEERLLLPLDHCRHAVDRLRQFGIGPTHHFGHGPRQGMQEGVPHAHLPAVEHGPPQQALHDIFFLVVARHHIFVDGKGAGADMVGNPPHASAVVVAGHIMFSAHFPHRFHQRPQDVDVEVAVDSLQHGAGALQSHAGVDVAARQRPQVIWRRSHPVELREDEVPDFHVTAVGHPVEEFAAGAAHSIGALGGGTGGPEIIVLAHAGDAGRRHADFIRPDGVGLSVVLIDRHRQLFGWDVQPVFGREEFPCPVDRLPLEVIAKAEVAEHFKERVMASGPPHVLDIAGAEALLAGGGPGEIEFAFAKEMVLELVHSGGSEQHRRVPAWHQHVTRAADAALRFKKCQIGFAEIVGLHVAIGSQEKVPDKPLSAGGINSCPTKRATIHARKKAQYHKLRGYTRPPERPKPKWPRKERAERLFRVPPGAGGRWAASAGGSGKSGDYSSESSPAAVSGSTAMIASLLSSTFWRISSATAGLSLRNWRAFSRP